MEAERLHLHFGIPLQGIQADDRLHITELDMRKDLGPGGLPAQLTIDSIIAALAGLRLEHIPVRFDRIEGRQGYALKWGCDRSSHVQLLAVRELLTKATQARGLAP